MLVFNFAVSLLKTKYLLYRCFPLVFGLVSECVAAFSENNFCSLSQIYKEV